MLKICFILIAMLMVGCAKPNGENASLKNSVVGSPSENYDYPNYQNAIVEVQHYLDHYHYREPVKGYKDFCHRLKYGLVLTTYDFTLECSLIIKFEPKWSPNEP